MNVKIINWNDENLAINNDKAVGIKIFTLLESNERGTYITTINPGASVTAHYFLPTLVLR